MMLAAKNLVELLKMNCMENIGIIFINGDKEESFLSYMELYNSALKTLGYLQKKGLKQKDELVFQFEDNKEFIICFWACILGGIIPVPISVGNNDEHRLKILRIWEILKRPNIIIKEKALELLKKQAFDSGMGQIYGNIEYKNIAGDNLFDYEAYGEIAIPNINDTAFIQFSSGSTGDPKGVVLTHKNLLTNINAIVIGAKLEANESTLSWMPLTHDMGLIGFHLSPLASGMNQYIMPTSLFIRRPTLWLKKAWEHKVTILSSPNFGYRYFLSFFKPEQAEGWDFSKIRLIFNGAEPISAELCSEFIDAMGKYGMKKNVIFPVYGLAEASLAVTFPPAGEEFKRVYLHRNHLAIGEKVLYLNAEDKNGVTFVDLGFSVTDCKYRISKEDNEVLGENTIGRIQIKGDNVTLGYYENIEATNEIIDSKGWLDTGDLGFSREGRLYVTGRAKDVIFVNGQNYYAHDIERIAEEVDNVALGEVAACSFVNPENNKDEVILFVLYKKEVESFLPLALEIKNYIFKTSGLDIKEVLPVKKIPKTTSGKIQRFKLGENYANGHYTSQIETLKSIMSEREIKVEIPRNETEEKLVALWCEIFKKDNIGIHDKFFDLGGDSLTLMQITAELEKEFGVELGFNDLLQYDTIAKIGEIIRINSLGAQKKYSQIKCNIEEISLPFPLTDVQMAYFMGREQQFEIGGVSTHMFSEIETSLDIKKFETALNKVIKRHPMLRAIVLKNGLQKILSEVPFYNIITDDLSNADKCSLEHKIKHERDRMSHHVFKTDCWPLFEFKAYKTSEHSHHLFIGFDLLIADGLSMQIICKELMYFYENSEKMLPEIDITFRDYIIAYKDLKGTPIYNKDKEYWTNKLDIFPSAPALPTKCNPADVVKPHFKRKNKIVTKDKWEKIKKYARINQTTPSALLCTAYAEVLAFWGNQPHHAINVTVFNRYPFHKDVDKIVGDFTSVMLVDVNLKSHETFWERAKKIQSTLMEALEHRHYDGVEFIRDIVNYNGLSNTKAVMPYVFTSMIFGEEENKGGYGSIFGDVKYSISQTSQVFIDYQAMEINGNLSVSWDYVEEIFDENMIVSMFDHYTSILENISQGEYKSYYLNETDSKMVKEYNNTEEFIKEATLHGLFMEQALKTPENIAVLFGEEKLTYEELNKKSSQIAVYLKSIGVKRKDFVAVSGKRCIDTIVNVFGILKAGAAYVPIDPEYPKERVEYILENSKCPVMLTPEIYNEKNIGNIVYENIANEFYPEDVAYVIYTSGSTGRPKGVVISHKAAANTIIDINQKYSVTEKDRILGISSMCFDLSVYDIFGALSTGATLVLISDQRNVKEMINAIENQKITIWNSVPAIMGMLVDNFNSLSEESNLDFIEKSRESCKVICDEKKLFWSPVIHWEENENEIIIKNRRYGAGEKNLFPKFYFLAQKGTTLKELYNEFKNIENETLFNFVNELSKESVLVDSILTPQEVFSTQDKLFENKFSDKILYDSEEYCKFKNLHLSRNLVVKKDEDNVIMLEDDFELPEYIKNRRTYRKFEEKLKIPFKILSKILSVLKQVRTDEGIRYYYASAGGLYPIDIYLYVKKNRVEGLKQGLYYYSPIHNNLSIIGEDAVFKDNIHYFSNKSIFNSSAVSVFMIYNAEVTMPKYGSMGYFYAGIDAGVMVSAITQVAEVNGVGICSIGDLDFSKIEKYFMLNKNQRLIHTVEIGIKSDLTLWHNEAYCETEDREVKKSKEIQSYENNNKLRLVMLSGDWIPLSLPDKIRNRFSNVEIFSLGGATEASIWSIHYPIKEIRPTWKSIPYGMPLANQTFYVLNFENELCPLGVQGELYIGGTGVALGYLNDEEKTKNSFISHPKYGRLYRTGDYGILHNEGYIEFMGRKDHQVKIKGYRIELGEIESQLLKHPKIKNGVIIDRIDNRGKKYICAYYVSEEEIASSDLKAFILKNLPEYMVPSFFIKMEKIPLTPNGKIERKKLPEPNIEGEERTLDLPENKTEEVILNIWKDLLKLDNIGTTDNFFELGGDSLNATTLITLIEKELGVEIPLSEVFRASTVKELSNLVLISDSKKKEETDTNLILLRRGNSNENLFFVHAGSGEMEVYIELSNRLDEKYNCWAIRADRYENTGPQNLTIESLAAKYVNKIRKVQPVGPYRVAGWCVGGTISFEITRQLEEIGEEVEFLGLINSLAPERGLINEQEFSVETEIALIKEFLPLGDKIEYLKEHKDTKTIWTNVLETIKTKNIDSDVLRKLMPKALARVMPSFDTVTSENMLYYANIFRTLQNARAFYIPQNSISAQVHFFEAIHERTENKKIWDEYCSNPIKLYEFEGDHVTILRNPKIEENSKIMKKVLEGKDN